MPLNVLPKFLGSRKEDRRKDKILPPQHERGLTVTESHPGRDASRSGHLCKRMASEVSRSERGMSWRLQNHGQM